MGDKHRNIQILDRIIGDQEPEDQAVLDALWSSLPPNPKICWYPSAGACARDLLVWRSRGLAQNYSEPDLFIHTDYWPTVYDLNHQDTKTRVSIRSSHTINIKGPIGYQVSEEFVDFPERYFDRPKVTVHYAEAVSTEVGRVIKPILYFHLENFNWFDELVLRRGLRISHFFKVRDGHGLGGGRVGMNNLYPALRTAGVEQMIVDQQISWNRYILNRYFHGPNMCTTRPYALTDQVKVGRLSGLETQAFRLVDTVSEDWFQAVVDAIAEECDYDSEPIPLEPMDENRRFRV